MSKAEKILEKLEEDDEYKFAKAQRKQYDFAEFPDDFTRKIDEYEDMDIDKIVEYIKNHTCPVCKHLREKFTTDYRERSDGSLLDVYVCAECVNLDDDTWWALLGDQETTLFEIRLGASSVTKELNIEHYDPRNVEKEDEKEEPQLYVLPIFVDDGRPKGSTYHSTIAFKSALENNEIMEKLEDARENALDEEEDTSVGLITDKFMEEDGIIPVKHDLPTTSHGVNIFLYDDHEIEEKVLDEY